MNLIGVQFAYVVEIQKPVTDKYSATYQKGYDCQKPVYMPMEFILNKEVLCLPQLSSIFKKNSLQKFWTDLFMNTDT